MGARVDGDLNGDLVDLADVRAGEHVERGTRSVDAPVGEQKERVGNVGRVVEVVQHNADSDAVLVREVAHEVEGLDLVAEVEVVCRLVEEHNTRALSDAGGQPDALDLATRKFAYGTLAHVGDPSGVHRMVDRGAVVGGEAGETTTVGVATEGDDLTNRKPLRSGAGLREERHLAGKVACAQQGDRASLCAFSSTRAVSATEHHAAIVDGMQLGERTKECGLSATVRADQRGDSSGFEGNRDTVDDDVLAVAQYELLAAHRGGVGYHARVGALGVGLRHGKPNRKWGRWLEPPSIGGAWCRRNWSLRRRWCRADVRPA